MQKALKIIASVLVLILILVVLLLPKQIDKKFNTVSQKPPYSISKEGRKLYDSLEFVADIHCDALLWKRDLLEKNDFGSVDILRMLATNVGLQAFTIVTKTPKNMNFDQNTGETDQVTLLTMAQMRPIKSWFNLTERALAQCKALHNFEEKSEGKFRVIESKADFEKYLEDKRQNKNITAGFLGIEGMHALEGKPENVDKLYEAGVRMMSPVYFF
jgi:microsomal dipeptidase-like Zn-dependent dipeptidase